MAGEFPELEEAIRRYQARITEIKARISQLEGELVFWANRRDTAKEFAKALEPPRDITKVGLAYLNAWGDEAVTGLSNYRDALERGETVIVPTFVAPIWKAVIVYGQIPTAQGEYQSLYTQLQDTKLELETVARALRDAELALESALLELRRAEALEEAERLAAEERKRIELDSIARDLLLGYPQMDADTARIIAEIAYQAAIGAIEGRYQKALEIARERARIWAQKEQIPGEPVFPEVVGIAGWLEKNWPWVLLISGVGSGITYGLVKLAKRRRK